MYHISDIKKYLRCERLYFFSKDDSNTFRPYLRFDENIIELLLEYFGIRKYYEGVRNDPGDRFLNEIDNYEWFVHPRICDGEMRVNIPFMHKKGDVFDLCFIYYGTQIKDVDLLTYRICLKVLNSHGLKVDDIYVVYLNGDYVNEGELDVQKLFRCINSFKGKRLIGLTVEGDFDYKATIKAMENFDPLKHKPVKNRYCRLYGLCSYYSDCFPEEEEEPDDSILYLVSSKNKNRMYKEGIKLLKDTDLGQLEGNRVQYAQIMASRNNGLYLEKLALANWLKKLEKRPISFIDFEWDRYLIPKYPKMKPMDVVCFEFALYYIDKDGHMEHRTFIGTGDCRREFVEALFAYLPEEGPILAYNAIGAECLRLKELAAIYPEYAPGLQAIIDRFVDLAVPFDEGMIYDSRMQGNFTLKKLVDICSDYSYKDLDIDDGMQAVYNWRNIDRKDTSDDKVIRDLEEYCSLDAYGLFLVYKWLIELMVESK